LQYRRLSSAQKGPDFTLFFQELPGRIFILDFAYISRMFPSDPGFFPKRRNICTATLWIPDLEYIYFMKIGQPKLSETFGKSQRSGLFEVIKFKA